MISFNEANKKLNEVDERIFKIIDKDMTLNIMTSPLGDYKNQDIKDYLIKRCEQELNCEKEILDKTLDRNNFNFKVRISSYENNIKLLKEIKGGE